MIVNFRIITASSLRRQGPSFLFRQLFRKSGAPAFAGATAVLAAVLITSFSTPAAAQTAVPPAPYADRQLDDPRLEAQASALMETVRCLVCQSQSIADSNASMAGDMRSQIRQRILAGEKPEQIRAWLVERYGAWVTYAPPVEPLTWPLWGAPILLLGIGLWLLRGRMKRHKRKDGES